MPFTNQYWARTARSSPYAASAAFAYTGSWSFVPSTVGLAVPRLGAILRNLSGLPVFMSVT